MDNKSYWCYILKNKDNAKNNTYCGCTENPIVRLKQHNGELKGGAKATKGRKWEYMLLIAGFEDKKSALSFEWNLKHPDNKKIKSSKYCGPKGRILGLNEVIKSCTHKLKLNIYISEKYFENLDNFNENIKVFPQQILNVI